MREKIAFLHFHKACGTSVVKYLKQRYPINLPNVNGNILDKNGVIRQFWNYNSDDLRTFLKLLDSFDNQLLVFEWGIPNISILKEYGYKPVTIVREPIERLLSNYLYDCRYHLKKKNALDYITNNQVLYQNLDYYDRMLEQRMFKDGLEYKKKREFYKTIVDNFEEIWTLERGCFEKIKGGNIIEVQNLGHENKSRRLKFLYESRKKEFEHAFKLLSINSDGFYDYLKGYNIVK